MSGGGLGSALGIGASLLGGALGGGSGEGGADIGGGLNQVIQASQQATNKANTEYNLVNQQNQAFLSPYITGGLTAYDAYNDALGLARPSDSVGGYLGLSKYNQAIQSAQGDSKKIDALYNSTIAELGNGSSTKNTYTFNGQHFYGTPSSSPLTDQQKIDSISNIDSYLKAKLGGLGDLGGRRADTFTDLDSKISGAGTLTAGQAPTGPDPNSQANWTTASQSSVLDKFRNSPGYQFALQEGLNAVSRQNAAKGLTNSGAELKGLNNYAQGQADQTYQNYVNNLGTASGVGYNATGLQVASNSNTGDKVGNAELVNGSNIGNAYLAGIQGQLANSAQQSANSNSMFGTLGSLAGNIFSSGSQPGGLFSSIGK